MKQLAIGFLIGALFLAGSLWLWDRINEGQDPYWKVSGTNSRYWHKREGNTDLHRQEVDIKECHRLVANHYSKAGYLTWEERLHQFVECMESKGYKFVAPEKQSGE